MFFLGLQFQASVIKHPNPKNPNEYKCNESVGGTVAIYDPTSAELEFGLKVLKSYQVLGYETHFSRIDIIRDEGDPLLMEAELVNPSIYANYTGRGAIISEQVADYFKTQLDSHNGRYYRAVSPIHSTQHV